MTGNVHPDVPDVPSAGSTTVPPVPPLKNPGASSDPVEGAPPDPNLRALDNAKLAALSFGHTAKIRAFYFTLSVSALLFIAGTIMFAYMSHWMFGWQTILILFAFFTPATLVLTILIRAIYPADKEKTEDKKDDLSDMLPNAAVVKMIAELFKANGSK